MKKSTFKIVIILAIAIMLTVAFGIRHYADLGAIPEIVPCVAAIPLSLAIGLGLMAVLKDIISLNKEEIKG